MGTDEAVRGLRLDGARSRRRSAAAGSTSPTAATTGTPSSPRSPSCSPRSSRRRASRPGTYDLVIHPSNLWLTIHESIGHATELDRALGYEANYAGTSFATYDKLGTLQYGSPVMNVTGDRTVEHGLATVGYDDEGVETQRWDIVRDGVLVGYQLDRAMGHMKPELQRRPLQRLRLRRLPRPHPDPADGQRLAAALARRPLHRRPDRPRRARSLRRRRQVVVDRHAALQLPVHRPAVLPDRGRPAGRPGPRRRPTRPPRPTSGTRWRRSAARTPGSSAAPSTAARRNPGRSPPSATAARPSLFRDVRILNTTDEAGQR